MRPAAASADLLPALDVALDRVGGQSSLRRALRPFAVWRLPDEIAAELD
jgi:hypothetical protein